MPRMSVKGHKKARCFICSRARMAICAVIIIAAVYTAVTIIEVVASLRFELLNLKSHFQSEQRKMEATMNAMNDMLGIEHGNMQTMNDKLLALGDVLAKGLHSDQARLAVQQQFLFACPEISDHRLRRKGVRCEFNCDDEWVNQNREIIKQRQGGGHGEVTQAVVAALEHADIEIVRSSDNNFGDGTGGAGLVSAKEPTGSSRGFAVASLGSSVPYRAASICRAVRNCTAVVALDGSRKAVQLGAAIMEESLGFSCGGLDKLPSSGAPARGAYYPLEALLGEGEIQWHGTAPFDVVDISHVLCHIERAKLPAVLSDVDAAIVPGGWFASSDLAMKPLVNAEDVATWVPANMGYGRMKSCLRGEVFSAWMWLTGYYEYESLQCRSYLSVDSPVVYAWSKWGNKLQKAQAYPPILNWYARKMQHPSGGQAMEPGRWPQFEGPGCCDESGLPKGRFDLHGPHYDGVDDPNFTICTGVVRKKPSEETAHLPPFRAQISEVSRLLETPQWDSCAQPGNATKAAMDGTF